MLQWCTANGHGVATDDGIRLHHGGHHILAAEQRHDLRPAVVDGLTWARLVEGFETWLGTREPEGLTAPALHATPPPAPTFDTQDTPTLAGVALEEAANARRLVARLPTGPDDPPASARWTAYRPGVHPLAFTAEECDYLLRITGPRRRGESYRLAGVPCAGARRWVHERLALAATYANAVWWRFELSATGHVQVLEYGPGDRMEEHTDASPLFPARKLSVVVMLSEPDAYEGGELELLHDPVATRPPRDRGTVVVFPSTLLHRVTPVTSGRRFALTGFCEGPPLR